MGSKIQNRKARKYVNATTAQHGKVALRSLHFRSQTALHTVWNYPRLARASSDYNETAPYEKQLAELRCHRRVRRGSAAKNPSDFQKKSLASRALGPHPFPSRTRSLSQAAPMVLRSRDRGRVGRCRHLLKPPSLLCGGGFVVSIFHQRRCRPRFGTSQLLLFQMFPRETLAADPHQMALHSAQRESVHRLYSHVHVIDPRVLFRK